MNTLQPGDTVPSFTTVDQDEKTVSSSDLTGKKKYRIFLSKGQYTWMYVRSV